MTDTLHFASLRKLADGLRAREYTSRELTQTYLDRISQHDGELNSYITLCADEALLAAEMADKRLAQGDTSPLLGIPVAHKDIFCTKGVKTSCGSKMLDNFIAPYNATVVEKLASAGMVMLGKTNMDEFAMGSSNETSFYGPVKNPWHTGMVPGGSSGGSAAVVAAGLAPVSTGTDTGGSIRQPAALCGVTGIKPTYGRVSRWGMIAFASSLDQGGVFARSAEDTALVLEAMAGFDSRDSTSIEKAVPNYADALGNPLKGMKVGLPEEYFADGLDDSVRDVVDQAIDEFRAQGAEVRPVTLPNTGLAVPTYYVVAPAEASSNLSRFDGVRYGYRAEAPADLEDLYKRSRGEGFGREVQRRIMVGTYALSAGYYDAYYLKAQKARQLISDDFRKAFEEVDLILGPTTQGVAFGLGDKLDDPVSMYLNDIYTIPANLAGLPGMSVPAGFVNGLPVGLQLIAPWFEEGRLLSAAHQYQQVTDWHHRAPEAFK